ncbi:MULTISPECIES: sensor histidine kinase [unclassified Pseudoxanthomonas]|uniref:sensor histidine kinase n=1 Tax=unclassified Pseudoxanthomonas TaxID=2645906 RepID=UPI0008EC12E7|nr:MULTISPECIES: sensor histidine kinase [unclassified Pseudoxanthomonas]SFV27614.1 Signal transduction histidine kinase [Pseudoxanthomonas sp. YR558]
MLRSLFLTVLLLVVGVPLSALPAHALDPGAGIGQLKHSRWMADDGVPLGIYALAQTPDGFLWIGSDAGLHRFDGVRFDAAAGPDGALRNEPVSALMAARNGDLWIGYQSGRMAVLRDGKLLDRSTPTSDRWVVRLYEDRAGGVWAMTGNTRHPLLRYSGARWEHIETAWAFTGTYAWSMAESGDGRLWLADATEVMVLAPGERRLRRTGIVSKIESGDNFGLTADSTGRVWQSSAFSGTRRLPDAAHAQGTPDATVPVSSVGHFYRSFLFDRDGAIWGITYSAGIYRIARPQRLYAGERPLEESFTAKDGLSSDRAQAILEDREGNIWIGTSAGLDRFRPANIRPAAGVTAHSPLGYVLMGTRDGTVYVADSVSVLRVPVVGDATRVLEGLRNPQALCEDRDGALWVKTGDALFRGIEGRYERMPVPETPRGALDCVVTADGRRWFNRVRGGLMRYENGAWIDALPESADDEAPKIPAMIEAPSGGLLMYARSLGLVLSEPPRMRMLWKHADIPGGEVTVLYPVGKDVIVASLGGVARLRDGKVTTLRRNDAWLLGITGITESRDGYIWLQSRAGIARLRREAFLGSFDTPARPLEVELLDFDDGLRAPPAPGYARNSALTGGDGTLWLLTTDGVAQIQPTQLARNPVPPPVRIVGLAYGSQRLRDPTSATLPAGVSRIEIDYTALSLSVPSRVRFRYRLEGVDEDWINAGHRRQAFYTNLDPGQYRFRVIAANDSGVWNEKGATLAFVVPPTFLQSIWFKALLVLAVAVLLWGLYALRLRYETARLRDRFQGQIAERTRIARELHDTLLQEFQALTLRFQGAVDCLRTDARTHDALTRALDRADEALKAGRERVHDLRAPHTGDHLPDALQDTARHLIDDGALDLQISVEGIPRLLVDAAAEEVRRIAEEALRNVVRHAQARNACIVLAYRTEGLSMTIRDDGIGLRAKADGDDDHFGCAGMRERAQQLGGRLDIGNAPAGGTVVELFVPARHLYCQRHAGFWGWLVRRDAAPRDDVR